MRSERKGFALSDCARTAHGCGGRRGWWATAVREMTAGRSREHRSARPPARMQKGDSDRHRCVDVRRPRCGGASPRSAATCRKSLLRIPSFADSGSARGLGPSSAGRRSLTERVVETLAAAHCNLVLPETVYYGRTIFPAGQDSPLAQWDEFRGTDPLATLIESAHRRGIQVHAWCHIFFVGFSDSPLVAAHPGWLARDRPEPHSLRPRRRLLLLPTDSSRGARVDPENPRGLGPPISRRRNSSRLHPLSQCARRRRRIRLQPAGPGAVSRQDGLRSLAISRRTDPASWDEWNRFREEAVTSFVREARRRLTALRPICNCPRPSSLPWMMPGSTRSRTGNHGRMPGCSTISPDGLFHGRSAR